MLPPPHRVVLDHGAKREVRRELTVRERLPGHGGRVAPAVEPASDGVGLVREPVRLDVRVPHGLLRDQRGQAQKLSCRVPQIIPDYYKCLIVFMRMQT